MLPNERPRPPGPNHVMRHRVPDVVALGIWFGAHALLGLAMQRSPVIATLHALLAVGVGAVVTAFGSRPQRATYFAAYIVGAEVLWRMSSAHVFWEFGKYATALILLIGLFRLRGRIRWYGFPLLYFAALLPSAWLALSTFDHSTAIEQISFNLSGPFLLALACIYFSTVRPASVSVRAVTLAAMGPIMGIAARTVASTYLADQAIRFGRNSNFAASGGFGPNQVSAALGLGALAALIYLLHRRSPTATRVLVAAVGLLFLSQSALTFSRGGLYGALGAAILGGLVLIKDRRRRFAALVAAGAFMVAANYVLLPRLDAFTGGALLQRLHDTRTSHRAEILLEDLRAWNEHPVLGVGPGGSDRYHYDQAAAHIEYTRLLAEHGVLGLVSLLALLYMAAALCLSTRTPSRRALAVSLVSWSLLFMVHSAMRLAAPAFLFGLAVTCSAIVELPLRARRAVRASVQPSVARAGATTP